MIYHLTKKLKSNPNQKIYRIQGDMDSYLSKKQKYKKNIISHNWNYIQIADFIFCNDSCHITMEIHCIYAESRKRWIHAFTKSNSIEWVWIATAEIWTQFADSIYCDNNCYTIMYVCISSEVTWLKANKKLSRHN